MITRRTLITASPAALLLAQQPAPFRWPEGKQCAVSLSWDDARLTQIDNGIGFLAKHGVKATFYILPSNWKRRLDGWKAALKEGHELAHHSNTHPCSVNFGFSNKNGLEDYTFEKMERDLDAGNEAFQETFGMKPVSFAYPCGQKYVGRGEQTRSYVPAVAKRFLTGRGYLDEASNNPATCDLANLMGTGFDNLAWPDMKRITDVARKEARWLILAGHEMGGKPGGQTTNLEALGELIAYCKDPANGIWLDTVASVGGYVRKQRGF